MSVDELVEIYGAVPPVKVRRMLVEDVLDHFLREVGVITPAMLRGIEYAMSAAYREAAK